MDRFYSNGKLLLTGEYLVLDGAKALALPTAFGQDLVVEKIQGNQLVWESYTKEGVLWFEALFELPKIRLVQATFTSEAEGSAEFIAETLQNLLQEARRLNSKFLQIDSGVKISTHLTFDRSWGLGSSSTLINNLANWARVNPYTLLWNAFSGSGYDIACAQHNTAIFYQNNDQKPIVAPITFQPEFSDQLYFVHLNKKQNSREGIAKYKEYTGDISNFKQQISDISERMTEVSSISEFEELISLHEDIVSRIIGLKPVKQELFSDYFGAIKSLGAWGGDFVLATGNETTPEYFRSKGYHTILSYKEMIL